jgi:hypothetical protein
VHTPTPPSTAPASKNFHPPNVSNGTRSHIQRFFWSPIYASRNFLGLQLGRHRLHMHRDSRMEMRRRFAAACSHGHSASHRDPLALRPSNAWALSIRPIGKRGGAVIEYRRDPPFGIIEYRHGHAAPEVVLEVLPGWPLPTKLAKLAMSCARSGRASGSSPGPSSSASPSSGALEPAARARYRRLSPISR